MYLCFCFFFFFKQKTAYEMRISDWSSDVCSSDLSPDGQRIAFVAPNKGQANDLYVVEIADGAAPRRILRASGEPETLRWCRWSSNARILCQVGGRADYGGQLYGFTTLVAVDAPGGTTKVIRPRRGKTEPGYYFSGGRAPDRHPGQGGRGAI